MWMRKKSFTKQTILPVALAFLTSWTPLLLLAPTAKAGEVEPFSPIVKLVESFYRVKQKRLRLMGLAKLGARVAGVKTAKKFKFAIFENQDFVGRGDNTEFAALIGKAFDKEWQPLVLLQSTRDGEQVYTYLRNTNSENVRLLLVNVGRRRAAVIQVDIAPQDLLKLLEQPDTLSTSLTDEATDESSH
ncbi:MAG: hypothetical protein ABR577_12840 [Pyrinomonadaceae bacterium]